MYLNELLSGSRSELFFRIADAFINPGDNYFINEIATLLNIDLAGSSATTSTTTTTTTTTVI